MKVLLIGAGGREHAILHAIYRSPRVDKIYVAPGNAGMRDMAELVDIGVMEFDQLVAFAREKAIDLAVCSQDDPLCAGIVDAFEEAGIRIFGTRKNAAIIEGSKAFSKNLMKKYAIPTASYEVFTDPDAACAYLEHESYPIVLKADGLALGKGVLICQDFEEAKAGVKEIMTDKKFGSAGNELVIEEFMTGREVSALAFCDGRHYKLMTSSQDHKRVGDGDTGLNTGGMGTFSPSPFFTDEIRDYCDKHIFQPTLDAMLAEGREFKGVLYFGLMLTADGPKVVEYNTRFGDPETQVVLPRMKTDIIDAFEACIDGKLEDLDLEFEDNAAVCVVLASKGYPLSYEKGFPISGFEHFDNVRDFCFHAGTRLAADGTVVTNGGRVLGITSKGASLREARDNAYRATDWISFANKYMRHDIGKAIDEASETR
nr:phosphoribosylamine--glycine ligase [Shuttleworthia satelles]